MNPPVPLHFVTPVWGAEYTRVFLEVTLPSLLAPGNIPSLPNLAECLYRIYTTADDAEVIKRSAAHARLSALVPVEFVPIKRPEGNKYGTSSDCYRAAVRDAAARRCASVLLIPDMVFADGGISTISRLLAEGKRAVLVMGLRAVKETLVPAVQARFGRDGCVAIPPRALVRLGLEHLHPIATSHMYEERDGRFNPSVMCWKAGAEGVLLHSFHLHPVVVHVDERGASFSGTIDDDLVEGAGFAPGEVHVAADSDELVWFEISARESTVPGPTDRSTEQIVAWMSNATTDYQRGVFRTPIRIHAGALSDAAWIDAEERARRVVEALLSAYARSSASAMGRMKLRAAALERRARTYLEFGRAQRATGLAAAVKRLAALGIVAGLRSVRAAYRRVRPR